ncbi:hypothetical protein [Duganella hordei]|uniref:hypothetical protein n=1 Tax=Duganella hordei TaxID=2865934 RepID=UPI0030E7A4BD
MKARSSSFLPQVLWLLFAIAGALSLIMMFKAGCAGDPKGGSYGDPASVLELEGSAFVLHILSAAFGGVGVACISKSTNRGAVSVAFALLVLMLLWFAGIQIEVWGVHSCFTQP